MAYFERPSLNTLLERVYRHYPRGVEEDYPHRRSAFEESRRLVCVQEAASKSCEWGFYEFPDDWREPIDNEVLAVIDALKPWRLMAKRWDKEVSRYLLFDDSNPWHDACYKYSAIRPGYVEFSNEPTDRVTASVSILAPVYAIHRSIGSPNESPRAQYVDFPARYQERIDKLCEYIENLFGFHRLDEETIMYPLPDVVHGYSNKFLGSAILRDLIFSPSIGPAESPE